MFPSAYLLCCAVLPHDHSVRYSSPPIVLCYPQLPVPVLRAANVPVWCHHGGVAHCSLHGDALSRPEYVVCAPTAVQFATKDSHILEADIARVVNVLSRNEFTTLYTLATLDMLEVSSERAATLPASVTSAAAATDSDPSAASAPAPGKTPVDVVRSLLRSGVLSNPAGVSRWNLNRLRNDLELDLLSAGSSFDVTALKYTLLSAHVLKGENITPELRSHFLGAYFHDSPIAGMLAPSGRFPHLASTFKHHIQSIAAAYASIGDAASKFLPTASRLVRASRWMLWLWALAGTAPPVRHLRRFGLINKLVAQLFDHTTTLDEKLCEDYTVLVSLATCVNDAAPDAVKASQILNARTLATVLSNISQVRAS